MKKVFIVLLFLKVNIALSQKSEEEKFVDKLIEKADSITRIGTQELKKGNYQKAIYFYEKAYEVFPTHIYQENIANAYVSDNNYYQAIQVYNKLINETIDKEYGNVNLSDFYLRRGAYKMELNDFRGAILDFDKSMAQLSEIYTGDHTKYSYYAKLYKVSCFIGLRRFDEGLKLCDELIMNCNDIISQENESNRLSGWISKAKIILPYAHEKLGNMQYFYIKDIEKACTSWSKSGELGNENAYNLITKYCN